jgi:hypothetical protein
VSRRCKHVSVHWLDATGYPVWPGDLKTIARRCVDCRAYLPWGPATMTPAVVVELRAAHLATAECALDLDGVTCPDEDEGWNLELLEADGDRDDELPRVLTDEHLAGWLAYEIWVTRGRDA